jgi:hypothetical protein
MDKKIEQDDIGDILHSIAWAVKEGAGLDYISSYSGVPLPIVGSILQQLTKWIRDGKRYNSRIGNRNAVSWEVMDCPDDCPECKYMDRVENKNGLPPEFVELY